MVTARAFQEKVSASFFEKKEAKKLLLTAGFFTRVATTPRTKSFLLPRAGGLFFKKAALTLNNRRPTIDGKDLPGNMPRRV
jgi:hypothetical protein